MYETLVYKKEAGLGIITLNQPNVLNALNAKAYEELYEVAELADQDDGIQVLIFHGAGRGFCAGDNITDGDLLKKRTSMGAYQYILGLQRVFNRIESIKKPVIAAIHGAACGGGLELALVCDIRIAAESARLGLPELKLGALPCIGGTQRLPRLIGTAKTKELLFTGKLLPAVEAERLGIINQVVPDGRELEEAVSMANVIKERSSLALHMAKAVVDQGRNHDLYTALEIEARNDAMLFDTADFREGMLAFSEKRPPVFRGR